MYNTPPPRSPIAKTAPTPPPASAATLGPASVTQFSSVDMNNDDINLVHESRSSEYQFEYLPVRLEMSRTVLQAINFTSDIVTVTSFRTCSVALLQTYLEDNRAGNRPRAELELMVSEFPDYQIENLNLLAHRMLMVKNVGENYERYHLNWGSSFQRNMLALQCCPQRNSYHLWRNEESWSCCRWIRSKIVGCNGQIPNNYQTSLLHLEL